MDASRRHKTPWSEMKESVWLSAIAVARERERERVSSKTRSKPDPALEEDTISVIQGCSLYKDPWKDRTKSS